MTFNLSAQTIFFTLFLGVFAPIALFLAIWFHLRKDQQPIKARYPYLVAISNLILILFAVSLCIQRMIPDSYPCWVTMWSGYAGTVIICNAYVVRCWLLYFTYAATMRMANNDSSSISSSRNYFNINDAVDSSSSKNNSDNDWLTKTKSFTSPTTIAIVLGTFTVALMVPASIVHAISYEVRNTAGDSCDRLFADFFLASYVGVYLLIFIIFAWKLKDVDDAFHIKEELRGVGIACATAVLPWYLFNNALKSINMSVFPFSTLALLAAITAAFIHTTALPLYYSIRPAPVLNWLTTPDEISTLPKLLSTDVGYDTFHKFLQKEMALENLLFWKDCKAYQKFASTKGVTYSQLVTRAQYMFDQFIARNLAPMEINLPGPIIDKIESSLKGQTSDSIGIELPLLPPSSISSSSSTTAEPARSISPLITIFDDALNNITHLMTTDSYKRFVTSDLYKNLLTKLEQNQAELARLEKLNVI